MKITKSYLKQVIKEELSRLTENYGTGDIVHYFKQPEKDKLFKVLAVKGEQAKIVPVDSATGKPAGEPIVVSLDHITPSYIGAGY